MYFTGTATNIRDLLLKLRTHALAVGWLELAWDGSTSLTLRGVGDLGTDEILVKISILEDAGADLYNFQIEHGTIIAPNGNLGNLLSGDFLYVGLWNNPIDYWCSIDKNRIICFMKIGSYYSSMHLGFFDSDGTKDQYPYPMLLGGTEDTNLSWTNTNHDNWYRGDRHRSVIDPSLAVGSQRRVSSHHGIPSIKTYPSSFITTLDEEYLLLPMLISYKAVHLFSCGEVKGLFFIPGFNLASETVITVGTDNYIVFNNYDSSGRNDWVAMLMA